MKAQRSLSNKPSNSLGRRNSIPDWPDFTKAKQVLMECATPLIIFTGGDDAPWAAEAPWRQDWCRDHITNSLIISPLDAAHLQIARKTRAPRPSRILRSRLAHLYYYHFAESLFPTKLYLRDCGGNGPGGYGLVCRIRKRPGHQYYDTLGYFGALQHAHRGFTGVPKAKRARLKELPGWREAPAEGMPGEAAHPLRPERPRRAG